MKGHRAISLLQRRILNHLGIEGTQHIQSIQNNLQMNYATTHRSVIRLNNLDLIWLSKHDNSHPKNPKFFSLTPLGVVEIFLRSELEQKIGKIIVDNWGSYSPKYILKWYDFDTKTRKNIKEVLFDMYPDIVYFRDLNKKIDWRPLSIIFYSNILDMNLLYQIMKLRTNIDVDDFIKIMKTDKMFKENWKRYYSAQKLLFDYVKKINDEHFSN